MPLPADNCARHVHYPLHVGDQILATCGQHYGQLIADIDGEPEPPIDFLVAMEQKLRAEAAIRRAKKRNRQASGGTR